MSEVVNGGDPDALAAEFVLGTLDSDERAHAQSLLGADEEFQAKVKVWERRLGELHLMVEPVEPDGQIWERIKAKMPQPRYRRGRSACRGSGTCSGSPGGNRGACRDPRFPH